jgi:nitrite reductase/ring-hydroxylating ferredoxin subunit
MQTARHMRMLGLGTAVAAAIPGIVDYLTAVPPKSSAQKRATNHMLSNVSALGLFAASAAGANGSGRPPLWTLAAEAAGAAALAIGGWLGGTLVYRNQIAVDHRYAEAGKWQPKTLPPPRDETEPIDIGSTDQLDINQMKLLRLRDRRLVLARTELGYVAFDDRCTHRGGPLSDGTLACGIVQCPWHGSQFDVHSGSVRSGPAEEGIRRFDVSERDNRLFLELGIRRAGVPDSRMSFVPPTRDRASR